MTVRFPPPTQQQRRTLAIWTVIAAAIGGVTIVTGVVSHHGAQIVLGSLLIVGWLFLLVRTLRRGDRPVVMSQRTWRRRRRTWRLMLGIQDLYLGLLLAAILAAVVIALIRGEPASAGVGLALFVVGVAVLWPLRRRLKRRMAAVEARAEWDPPEPPLL